MVFHLLPLALLAPLSAQAGDFEGAFAIDGWDTTGIQGGTATADTNASDANQLVFIYKVDLGGGGVSQRTAEFEMTVPEDGVVELDWEHEYFHAWFQVTGELTFYAYDNNNVRHERVAHSTSGGGTQNKSGHLAALDVYAGKAFGIEVGGRNHDSTSVLEGQVVLTDLDYLIYDCAGTLGGSAETDECGVCDDDPNNDCVQDCSGAWGGVATLDGCGTCDADANNDCMQDCSGVLGGPALPDSCGTCDEDPTNDCVQDCSGDWGGSAELDGCDGCTGGATGLPPADCEDTGDSNDPDDTAAPTDTSDEPLTWDTGDVRGLSSPANDEASPGQRCGCASGSSTPSGALFGGGFLLLLARRRRQF